MSDDFKDPWHPTDPLIWLYKKIARKSQLSTEELRSFKEKKYQPEAETPSVKEKRKIRKERYKVKHQSFRLTPPSFHDNSGVPNSFLLWWETLVFVWKHPFSFAFMVLSYGLLMYFIAPQALTDQTDVTYSGLLTVFATLAIIRWVRHIEADDYRGIRDAYYHGMTQLIPFVIILFIFALQTLPMYIGVFFYDIAINNKLAATQIEQYIQYAVLALLAIPTLYWASSTLMSMYIVTLPGATPVQSLRASADLVNGRRFMIIRRIAMLFLVLAAIVVGMIIWFNDNGFEKAAEVGPVIFYIMTIPITNIYLYKLYRSLLE